MSKEVRRIYVCEQQHIAIAIDKNNLWLTIGVYSSEKTKTLDNLYNWEAGETNKLPKSIRIMNLYFRQIEEFLPELEEILSRENYRNFYRLFLKTYKELATKSRAKLFEIEIRNLHISNNKKVDLIRNRIEFCVNYKSKVNFETKCPFWLTKDQAKKLIKMLEDKLIV